MKNKNLTINALAIAMMALTACSKQVKVTPGSAASGGKTQLIIPKTKLHHKDKSTIGDESFVDGTIKHVWCCPPGSDCDDTPNEPCSSIILDNIIHTIKTKSMEEVRDTFYVEQSYLIDSLGINQTDVHDVISGELNVVIEPGTPIHNVDTHPFFSFYHGAEFNIDSVTSAYGFAVDTL